MEAKTFHSRLFKKKINPDNPDYWTFLYAELLFRIRQIYDLNCVRHFCGPEINRLNSVIKEMGKNKLIEENQKPSKLANRGYCSKKLKEDAEIASMVNRK